MSGCHYDKGDNFIMKVHVIVSFTGECFQECGAILTEKTFLLRKSKFFPMSFVAYDKGGNHFIRVISAGGLFIHL